MLRSSGWSGWDEWLENGRRNDECLQNGRFIKIMMLVAKLVRCKWEKWRMRISQLEDVNNAAGSVQCSRGRVNAGSALE